MDRRHDGRTAEPDDPDLSIDVMVTLSAVVMDGSWILMRFVAGSGVVRPDDLDDPVPITNVVLDVTAHLPQAPQALIDSYVRQLEGWRDADVELRFCSAPGRVGSLTDPDGEWLPIPSWRRAT